MKKPFAAVLCSTAAIVLMSAPVMAGGCTKTCQEHTYLPGLSCQEAQMFLINWENLNPQADCGQVVQNGSTCTYYQGTDQQICSSGGGSGGGSGSGNPPVICGIGVTDCIPPSICDRNSPLYNKVDCCKEFPTWCPGS